MAKPIEKDGKFYRMRRGKLVEIPPKWLGRVTGRQTIKKRRSKMLHKFRKWAKHGSWRYETRRKMDEDGEKELRRILKGAP